MKSAASVPPYRLRALSRIALVFLGSLFLNACGKPDTSTTQTGNASPSAPQPEQTLDMDDPELTAFTGDLKQMRERRVVRALVVPSRTDFFIDSGVIKGIQAEFLNEFGNHLNQGEERETKLLRIKYIPVSFDQLIPKLRSGQGDIAAAFLTQTGERSQQVSFAKAFRSNVKEVLVSRRGFNAPTSVDGLSGKKIYVLRESSYLEHLKALNQQFSKRGLAPIQIELADARLTSDDILELVNAGVVDMTVIDDYKARLWSSVLTKLKVHDQVVIHEGGSLSWAVRPGAKDLLKEINTFSEKVRKGSLLGNILFKRYFDSITFIDNPTERAKQDKLQQYMTLFQTYGEQYGFDPLALAAQAFQESQLDQSQRSHAGAVGLMQLLPSTAQDPNIDIKNIQKVENNVHAGAKYLAFLRDRYFSSEELSDWNSRAFAWAAYNAGPRKIREARAEAKNMGLDPNIWFDNVEVATGKIVSREPVRYVANIYKYYVAYRLALANES